MSNLWHCLEALSRGRLVGVTATWQALAGEHFEPLATAFLRPTEEHATAVPCPHECGCAHEVIVHAADDIVGICRCDSWDCPDLKLQPADVVLFELSWSRLGRAIARAFDCEAKEVDFKLSGTRQVAAFGAVGLPIVLTLRVERHEFRHVVAELMARLRRPFILLAPTNRALDGLGHELLANAQAGFFPLDSTLTLLPSGQLHSARPAGELFSPYLPAQAEETTSASAARQVFALIERMERESPTKPPTVLTVFRLYCLLGLSAQAVADKIGCAKATVLNRLRVIETVTGTNPEQFREQSDQFARMEGTLGDSRARSIYRPALAQEGGDYDAEG